MRYLLAMLLLVGSLSASICDNQSVQVCGTDGHTYPNESVSPVPVFYCGTCAQYDTYQASWNIWNTTANQSQYNTSNRSYMERFVSVSIGKILGNDEYGQFSLAILVGAFFFTFVSFQNVRVEGKAVVLVPAFVLAAYFVGWLATILSLGVGIVLFIALSKIFNK